MASVVYNSALQLMAAGSMALATADIRARLVMTDTSCDTQNGTIAYLSEFGTIDPSDATGYADVALTGLVVNLDSGNNRAEFDATNVAFTGLSGDATRDYQGVLLYQCIGTADAADKPLAFIDFSADVAKEATSVTVPWNEEGILQFAQA